MNVLISTLVIAATGIVFVAGAPSEVQRNTDNSTLDSFIIGGEDAKLGELPYQAWSDDYYDCGATIIDKLWVLTSARCIHTRGKIGFKVYAGMVDRKDDKAVVRTVVKSFWHPKFKIGLEGRNLLIENDFALLKLDEPYTFGPNVQPIKLAPAGHQPTGKVIAGGWGRTKSSEESKILQKIVLDVIEQKTCVENQIKDEVIVPPTSMCAGDFSGKKAACYGDLGSPLVDTKDKLLVGVVSHIPSTCTSKTLPNIGGRVGLQQNLDWIAQTIKNE